MSATLNKDSILSLSPSYSGKPGNGNLKVAVFHGQTGELLSQECPLAKHLDKLVATLADKFYTGDVVVTYIAQDGEWVETSRVVVNTEAREE